MSAGFRDPAGLTPFSEKGFYLSEFRGRTLAIAARAEDLARPASLLPVLAELEGNDTRVVLLSSRRRELALLPGTELLAATTEPLPGLVWRALRRAPRVGLVARPRDGFPADCWAIALRLAVPKLVWIDPGGGLRRAGGGVHSFVDHAELGALMQKGFPEEGPQRVGLLREIAAGLDAGLASVNLCHLEGLADELFTYAGAGTLFTRGRYIEVRRLQLDDFDAADDLMSRGVAEGYLAPRAPEQVDRVLTNGFGAFVEGRYLAGIGALLVHEDARAGEIASLYTITRFLGEGVGEHLVAHALGESRRRGLRSVFACTTSERVVAFFERHGFRRVAPERLPVDKWQDYDPARRTRLLCLERDPA